MIRPKLNKRVIHLAGSVCLTLIIVLLFFFVIPLGGRPASVRGVYTTTVDFVVHPGSNPPSVNLDNNGKVPVAILGSSTLNVQSIAVSSLNFEGATTKQYSFQDVNGDGIPDMVLHFDTNEITGLSSTSTTATITGDTSSGDAFVGTAPVNIVHNKK
jgi:hypothetical protein